jgi:hypothetical protein
MHQRSSLPLVPLMHTTTSVLRDETKSATECRRCLYELTHGVH